MSTFLLSPVMATPSSPTGDLAMDNGQSLPSHSVNNAQCDQRTGQWVTQQKQDRLLLCKQHCCYPENLMRIQQMICPSA